MKQQRHSVEQIIAKLRRADVELGKDRKVPEVCKILEITEQTYYRWRQKYGGMAPTMAREMKALQQENARLKKVVANQALDMEILREAARETGEPRTTTSNGGRGPSLFGARSSFRTQSLPGAGSTTGHATLSSLSLG